MSQKITTFRLVVELYPDVRKLCEKFVDRSKHWNTVTLIVDGWP